MKILILEDSSDRIKTFQKKLIGHDLFFYDNVKDAIEAVNLLGPFEFFFLDHDLDQKVYVPSDEENTGYKFALFLQSKKVDADIIIHTLNPVGAQNMKAVLPQAKVIPFINLFS